MKKNTLTGKIFEGTGHAYTVKDWFANKQAQELKRNINMFDLFAILKETEKAVYAMVNLGCDFKKTMWIPKSVLEEKEDGYETLLIEDYDEASIAFKNMWDSFR